MGGGTFGIPSFAVLAFDTLLIFAAVCLYIAMINFEGGPYLQGIHATQYSDRDMLGLAFWFLLAIYMARIISHPILIIASIFIILPIVLVVCLVLMRARGLWAIVRAATADTG